VPFEAPAVRAAVDAGFLVAGLDNDLVSYRREVDRGEADENILTVLLHGDPDLTLERAVADVVAMRDRMMSLFVRLHRQSAAASAEADRYLQAIGSSVAGSAAWGFMTERYAAPNSARSQLTWADLPCDESPGPVPVRSIAWWWDALEA
jgi:hypothetical protein